MNKYYGYTSGSIKTVKSKPGELLNMQYIVSNLVRFSVCTKVFKVFNDVEYKGTVTQCDLKKKLYHIHYEDGNPED